MEDVICSECNIVNGYHHNYCFHCGIHLKGTCTTCNREENITFVEAGVCQWHVLEDREELKEKFGILVNSIFLRYVAMFFGSLVLAGLVGAIAFYYLPQNLNRYVAVFGGCVVIILSFLYVSLWRHKKMYGSQQTLIANYKKSNPTEAELLEKVGWKILP